MKDISKDYSILPRKTPSLSFTLLFVLRLYWSLRFKRCISRSSYVLEDKTLKSKTSKGIKRSCNQQCWLKLDHNVGCVNESLMVNDHGDLKRALLEKNFIYSSYYCYILSKYLDHKPYFKSSDPFSADSFMTASDASSTFCKQPLRAANVAANDNPPAKAEPTNGTKRTYSSMLDSRA